MASDWWIESEKVDCEMTMTMNIIGAGNVARVLAHLFVNHQLVTIVGVYNRTEQHAMDAIRFIGEGTYYKNLMDLPHADVTLISTSDDYIATACRSFSNNPALQKNDIVFHCSGTLSSDCLSSVKEKGCFVASVHPVQSFKQPAQCVTTYSGTYCGMEGDEQALSILTPLFTAIGSRLFLIQKDKKALYHAAAVFASNYVVTLAQHAFDCLSESGLEDEMAKALILSLMQGTLTNMAHVSKPILALTGPVQRGDTETLHLHTNAFTNQKQQALYTLLMNATFELLPLLHN